MGGNALEASRTGGSAHARTMRPGEMADVSVPAAVGWERAFEVRDKPVTREDLYVLSRRSLEAGVAEAVMVAVASGQGDIPIAEAQAWSAQRGVALTVFLNWRSLISQVLLWCPMPQLPAATALPQLIRERLIELEVAPGSVSSWTDLYID